MRLSALRSNTRKLEQFAGIAQSRIPIIGMRDTWRSSRVSDEVEVARYGRADWKINSGREFRDRIVKFDKSRV